MGTKTKLTLEQKGLGPPRTLKRLGRVFTRTVPGRILLVGSAIGVGSNVYTSIKKDIKKLKKALKSEEYKGKNLKEIIKHDVKKLWEKGKKEWGVDQKTLLKNKKSIGGETVVMKSGGGYIDNLL